MANNVRRKFVRFVILQVPVINVKIRNHNAWFKELASHKPLSQLCKTKVPVFNKKEDIFQVSIVVVLILQYMQK